MLELPERHGLGDTERLCLGRVLPVPDSFCKRNPVHSSYLLKILRLHPVRTSKSAPFRRYGYNCPIRETDLLSQFSLFPTAFDDIALCIRYISWKYVVYTLLDIPNRFRLGDTDVIFVPPNDSYLK